MAERREQLQHKRMEQQLGTEELAAIQSAVESQIKDVTKQIETFTGETGLGTIKTKMRLKGETQLVDEKLVKQLAWLKKLKTQRDMVVERALEMGKLDCRRLWKAPINGAVFREDRVKPRQKHRVWLLVDQSGSMEGGTGERVYRMSAAAREALGDSCRVYAYDNQGSTALIERLDFGSSQMRQPKPSGGTPSGVCLAWIAEEMMKDGGGLIVHFTDGGCNTGYYPRQVGQLLDQKAKKVRVLNVCYGSGINQGYKPDTKKMKTVAIGSVEQFGAILEKEVREIMLGVV
jgi:hypothetical protein